MIHQILCKKSMFVFLILMLLVSSCSKDDIVINLTYPQNNTGDNTDKDDSSSNNGNNNSGSGTDTGGSSSSNKNKATLFFRADVMNLSTTNTGTSEIGVNRNVMINAYNKAGDLETSVAYTSNSSGSLTPNSGSAMKVPTGVYSLYAAGVNTEKAAIPAFNSSGVATSLENQMDYIWWGNSDYSVNDTISTISMNMKHCGIQVVVSILAEDSITINSVSGMSITPADVSGCSWNLKSGTITQATSLTTSTATMGVASTSSSYVGQIIMLPIKASGDFTVSFDVTINGESTPRSYSAQLPIYEGNMTAGNSYKYTVKLYESEIVVGGVYIINWVSVTANQTPIIPSEI